MSDLSEDLLGDYDLDELGRELMGDTCTRKKEVMKLAEQTTLIPPSKMMRKVHDRALRFDKAVRASTKMKAKRDDARAELVAAMEEKDITVYRHADVRVELINSTTPKVKVGLQEEGSSNGDGGEE